MRMILMIRATSHLSYALCVYWTPHSGTSWFITGPVDQDIQDDGVFWNELAKPSGALHMS